MQIIKHSVKEKHILNKDFRTRRFNENIFIKINSTHLLIENKTYLLCDSLVKQFIYFKSKQGANFLKLDLSVLYRSINHVSYYYCFLLNK